MSLRDARHALARLFPGAAAAVTSQLPLPVAESIGAGMGSLFTVAPNRVHRRSLENLERAFPEHPARRRAALARHALAHAGREATATVKWFARSREQLPELCENYDELVAAITADCAAGHGALYVGAHLGNPQLLSALCATVRPLTSIGTEYHTRTHLEFIARGRRRLGLHYVAATSPPIDLLRALQRNELVTFLPDVQPRRNTGLWVPFFGTPACTSTFPASLARLTRCVLRPIFLVREGPGYRALIHQPIATPGLEEGEAGLERATVAWSEALENEVRRRPEQWIWMSRRWRPMPDGARPIAAPTTTPMNTPTATPTATPPRAPASRAYASQAS